MKQSFLNPNWRAINKAFNSGDIEQIKALSLELSELNKKLSDKRKKYFADKLQAEALKTLSDLKAVPIGGTVYYKGYSTELAGVAGEVLKHGRTRLTVKFPSNIYSVLYKQVQIEPLTKDQLDSIHLTVSINKRLFNN